MTRGWFFAAERTSYAVKISKADRHASATKSKFASRPETGQEKPEIARGREFEGGESCGRVSEGEENDKRDRAPIEFTGNGRRATFFQLSSRYRWTDATIKAIDVYLPSRHASKTDTVGERIVRRWSCKVSQSLRLFPPLFGIFLNARKHWKWPLDRRIFTL